MVKVFDHRLAHEAIEGLLDPAAEDRVRCAPRRLKLDAVHALAEAFAEYPDRIDRRARRVRRIDPDDAGDAGGMAQGHLPDHETAPIVADENCLVDMQVIEQADQVAGQMLEVVGLDRSGAIGRAVAALIRRDHADAGRRKRLDLMPPRERDLRPAMAQHQRRRVSLWPRLVVAHADAVGLGELERRHFDGHGYSPSPRPGGGRGPGIDNDWN